MHCNLVPEGHVRSGILPGEGHRTQAGPNRPEAERAGTQGQEGKKQGPGAHSCERVEASTRKPRAGQRWGQRTQRRVRKQQEPISQVQHSRPWLRQLRERKGVETKKAEAPTREID